MHKQPVYQNAPAYVNGVSEAIFKVGVFSKTYPSFLTIKEVFRKPTRPSLPLRKAPPFSPSLSFLRDERM